MSTSRTVSIPSRYCGPPFSANGGYACGTTARALGTSAAEVTLHLPPPLDRPLALTGDGDEARLLDGDAVIATARPASPPEDGPVVSLSEAESSAAVLNLDEYTANHAYPGCFTCGPARAPGQGLRLFPAPTASPGVFATKWRPHHATSDGTGTVDFAVVWAALDCPSGISWLGSEPDIGPVVLGRMAAVIHQRPSVGDELVVAGWTKEASGRKRLAGSSIRTAEGELLAAAHATWIVLTEEQRAAFQAASPSA